MCLGQYVSRYVQLEPYSGWIKCSKFRNTLCILTKSASIVIFVFKDQSQRSRPIWESCPLSPTFQWNSEGGSYTSSAHMSSAVKIPEEEQAPSARTSSDFAAWCSQLLPKTSLPILPNPISGPNQVSHCSWPLLWRRAPQLLGIPDTAVPSRKLKASEGSVSGNSSQSNARISWELFKNPPPQHNSLKAPHLPHFLPSFPPSTLCHGSSLLYSRQELSSRCPHALAVVTKENVPKA